MQPFAMGSSSSAGPVVSSAGQPRKLSSVFEEMNEDADAGIAEEQHDGEDQQGEQNVEETGADDVGEAGMPWQGFVTSPPRQIGVAGRRSVGGSLQSGSSLGPAKSLARDGRAARHMSMTQFSNAADAVGHLRHNPHKRASIAEALALKSEVGDLEYVSSRERHDTREVDASAIRPNPSNRQVCFE